MVTSHALQTALHYIALHYILFILGYIELQLHYITLQSIAVVVTSYTLAADCLTLYITLYSYNVKLYYITLLYIA